MTKERRRARQILVATWHQGGAEVISRTHKVAKLGEKEKEVTRFSRWDLTRIGMEMPRKEMSPPEPLLCPATKWANFHISRSWSAPMFSSHQLATLIKNFTTMVLSLTRQI